MLAEVLEVWVVEAHEGVLEDYEQYATVLKQFLIQLHLQNAEKLIFVEGRSGSHQNDSPLPPKVALPHGALPPRHTGSLPLPVLGRRHTLKHMPTQFQEKDGTLTALRSQKLKSVMGDFATQSCEC